MKYGLIGCGMMGVEHIHNIALLDGARVAGVYDPVPDLAANAATVAGGAVVHSDLHSLVQAVDAVVIASPNYLHVDQLIDIANIRHIPILVEKPLYTHAADAARIADFQSRYTAPVWVAMEYRYMPPIARFAAKAAAATGGIEMLTIREHRFPFLPKVGDWNRFNRYTGGNVGGKVLPFL